MCFQPVDGHPAARNGNSPEDSQAAQVSPIEKQLM